MTVESFLFDITAFCERHNMSATAFGVAAVRDGNLVSDLKGGKRKPTLRLVEKVQNFMADRDAIKSRDDADRSTQEPARQ